MTPKRRERLLQTAFEDTIWMAIRYAHGRHTYAPGMVREAIRCFKEVFPDWKPREDETIGGPEDKLVGGMIFPDDYLGDLFTKD